MLKKMGQSGTHDNFIQLLTMGRGGKEMGSAAQFLGSSEKQNFPHTH